MRIGQDTSVRQENAQAIRVKVFAEIALRVGTVAGLAAAIMLVVSDVKAWNHTFLAYSWELSSESARPGDWVVATLKVPEAGELDQFSVSLDLPEEGGFSFVPGSMEVYAGNIDGARIPRYSGQTSLGIYEIPPQDGPLHFEISIQVPSDLDLLGKSVEIRPRFSVIGENFKSKPAVLTIEAEDLAIINTAVAAPSGQIGYEISVTNPNGGIRFDELNKSFDLEVEISHPEVRLVSEQIQVISDQVLPDFSGESNHVTITGLSLGTGENMSVFVPVELPQDILAAEVKALARATAESVSLSGKVMSTGKKSQISYDQIQVQNRSGRAFLSWVVHQEKENKGFFVEHSLDGATFQTLALIPGSEDHQEQVTYQFETEPLHRGRHLFRLRQEDRNGEKMYTNQQEIFIGIERPATVDLSHLPSEKGGYVSVAVQKRQEVVLELSSSAAGTSQTLFHGVMKPMVPYEILVNQQELPRGSYQLIFQGALEEITLPVDIAG